MVVKRNCKTCAYYEALLPKHVSVALRLMGERIPARCHHAGHNFASERTCCSEYRECEKECENE
jgi:hypothetical protein